RRHTSFSRDWSSDVCSSDLRPMSEGGPAQAFPPGRSYVPAAVNRAPCPGDDGGVDAVAASPVMEAVGRLLTGQTRTVGAISTGRDRKSAVEGESLVSGRGGV